MKKGSASISLLLIFLDMILVDGGGIQLPEKEVLAEDPDPVGHMVQWKCAEKDSVWAEDLELVDIRLLDDGFDNLPYSPWGRNLTPRFL